LLLEDIFILEASKANIKRQELRSVVGLDIKRVNRISKHVGSVAQEWLMATDSASLLLQVGELGLGTERL